MASHQRTPQSVLDAPSVTVGWVVQNDAAAAAKSPDPRAAFRDGRRRRARAARAHQRGLRRAAGRRPTWADIVAAREQAEQEVTG